MKYSLVLVTLLSVASFAADQDKAVVTQQTAPAPSNITVVCPTGSCTKPAEVQKVEVINPIQIAKSKKVEPPKPKKDVLTIQNLYLSVLLDKV
jgi:hypothetical protein